MSCHISATVFPWDLEAKHWDHPIQQTVHAAVNQLAQNLAFGATFETRTQHLKRPIWLFPILNLLNSSNIHNETKNFQK